MTQLDDAPVTDRPATTPAADVDEPRDRGQIALLGIAAAAVVTAVVVVMTSGSDASSTSTREDSAARRAAVTTPALTDPVLDAPANPTAEAAPSSAATEAPTTAPGTAAPTTATAATPGGWEPRTFEGVTFAVPPGSTSADVVDPGNADAPALFSWNGPDLGGGVFSHVSMWIYGTGGAPELGPEYTPITVPGADRAHMWTGATGTEPPTTTVDVHIVDGSRYINLVAAVAPGAAGEDIVRKLVASVVVG